MMQLRSLVICLIVLFPTTCHHTQTTDQQTYSTDDNKVNLIAWKSIYTANLSPMFFLNFFVSTNASWRICILVLVMFILRTNTISQLVFKVIAFTFKTFRYCWILLTLLHRCEYPCAFALSSFVPLMNSAWLCCKHVNYWTEIALFLLRNCKDWKAFLRRNVHLNWWRVVPFVVSLQYTFAIQTKNLDAFNLKGRI